MAQCASPLTSVLQVSWQCKSEFFNLFVCLLGLFICLFMVCRSVLWDLYGGITEWAFPEGYTVQGPTGEGLKVAAPEGHRWLMGNQHCGDTDFSHKPC